MAEDVSEVLEHAGKLAAQFEEAGNRFAGYHRTCVANCEYSVWDKRAAEELASAATIRALLNHITPQGGVEDKYSIPELPCAETGTHIPSSPQLSALLERVRVKGPYAAEWIEETSDWVVSAAKQPEGWQPFLLSDACGQAEAELIAGALNALPSLLTLLDEARAITCGATGDWSDWDQSVRDRITRWALAYEAARDMGSRAPQGADEGSGIDPNTPTPQGNRPSREEVARALARYRLVRGLDAWRLYEGDQRVDGPWGDTDVPTLMWNMAEIQQLVEAALASRPAGEEKLVEALRFYSNPGNHKCGDVFTDFGKKARAALKAHGVKGDE